jgi:cytochrome c oxidase subunit IV
VLTIVAALLDLGPLNVVIAMAIATVKAVLVILFFMHVKYSGRLVWIFSGASFFWLGILLVLLMSDYVTRGWVPGRLPSLPAAHVMGTAEPLQDVAPSPSAQMRGNPLAAPRVDLAPASTTQPVPLQPRGHD